MSRRHIFTERQRAALFDLPTDELSLLKFYTLGDDDLENIRQRRRPENRIGFALQLCALRYPGRALAPGEMIPREVLSFVGAQLGVPADALLTYATRRQTRQQHMDTLREIYGYKTFTGRGARDLREWTFGQAEDARSNEDLAHRFIVRCRETSTILPAVSTIERLCADALVAAERRIETRIAENLTADVRDHLDKLLSEMLAGNTQDWLADRKARLTIALKRLARAARNGTIPHGSIEDGTLRIDRLTADVPDGAEALILDLYRRMPSVRITDMLLEVDAALGFTDAFTHLRTGAPCRDRIGLLNVLLAEGLNLGLRKMAEATNTHDYWQLSRLARWHVESEAMNQALAIVVAAQGKLPMSRVWGMGTSASSDGQFFPTARHGEAMNMVNAKYGSVPGLKAYTHVSDQFAPFACQSIPATVSEAPYILDGLLMNEVGRHVREQYADTAGFTDHLFGASSLLGYNLVLRIRDLPSKRLYVFNPDTTPRELRKLVGGKAREDLIVANWPDIFRCAATMTAGKIRPSQLLRKLASYPRQNNLAVALREVGRIERTLFIIEWILDTDMQRRAQIGLNKGEAHHALKNALRIGRQGEIRDRTTEGQHYRIAGLNLLTAVIIYWNTVHLGHAVTERRNEGLDVPPEFLPHISPLGWAHILLTGEYLWPKEPKA
ncbi:Tn3 family transposase [Klebsiella pneumoniae]|nr:Tn3 family transposase [Klebsiella pneumoniae]